MDIKGPFSMKNRPMIDLALCTLIGPSLISMWFDTMPIDYSVM